MRKKSKITSAESQEFRQAMRDVKPLSHNKVKLSQPKRVRRPISKKVESDQVWSTGESTPPPEVNGEDSIEFKQLGVHDKILRKLSKGQYNIEAVLDLHGMTVATAKPALTNFLLKCLQKHIRVALIIHGKGHHSGKPVLKNKLNHWLRDIHAVLAFSTARARDGNRGALYVLLRDPQQEIDLE